MSMPLTLAANWALQHSPEHLKKYVAEGTTRRHLYTAWRDQTQETQQHSLSGQGRGLHPAPGGTPTTLHTAPSPKGDGVQRGLLFLRPACCPGLPQPSAASQAPAGTATLCWLASLSRFASSQRRPCCCLACPVRLYHSHELLVQHRPSAVRRAQLKPVPACRLQ